MDSSTLRYRKVGEREERGDGARERASGFSPHREKEHSPLLAVRQVINPLSEGLSEGESERESRGTWKRTASIRQDSRVSESVSASSDDDEEISGLEEGDGWTDDGQPLSTNKTRTKDSPVAGTGTGTDTGTDTDTGTGTRAGDHNRRPMFQSLSFEDQTYIPHGTSGTVRMKSLGRMHSHVFDDDRGISTSTPELDDRAVIGKKLPIRNVLRSDDLRRRPSLPSPRTKEVNRVNSNPILATQTPASLKERQPSNISDISRSQSMERSKSEEGVHEIKKTSIENNGLTPSKKVVGKQMSMNSSNRTAVGVKMKIKLDYIDDVNQEIHTEVFLTMHYRCLKAKEFISGQVGFVALAPEEYPDMYVPMVEFLNFRNCEHIEGFRLLVNTMSGVVYVYRVYRIVFRGLLKLNRFPFDRQIINIELKSFTAMLMPWSMPESDVPYGIRADVLWRNHDIVVECDGSLWDLSWTRGVVHQETNPSVYIASFGIGRISLFYVMNFFLVTFFVVGSVFGCQAIIYTDFGSRSSITFTILLTIISIKFIMSSYTPKISYLTWLDYYNLLGMIFLIVVILENYVVSTVSNFNVLCVYPFGFDYCSVSSEVVDMYVPRFLMWFWVLFHVFIFFGWLCEWFYESWDEVLNKEKRSDVARISGDVKVM